MAARPVEQQRADRIFQAGDLAAEGRLGDVEPFGRTPEMQLLGDGKKIAQPPYIDPQLRATDDPRSEERRVGKEGVGTGRSWLRPFHYTKNKTPITYTIHPAKKN